MGQLLLMRDPRQPSLPPGKAWKLLDDKAWDWFGITAEEFRVGWRAGQYADDHRSRVAILGCLLETHYWVGADVVDGDGAAADHDVGELPHPTANPDGG